MSDPQNDDPVFGEIESELEAEFAKTTEVATCEDEITIERITHDLDLFTSEQLPPVVKHEMKRQLEAGKYEVRYENRFGNRSKGTSAAVHFHGHEFFDEEQYLIYYSVQFKDGKAYWYLHGMFNLTEKFAYYWHE